MVVSNTNTYQKMKKSLLSKEKDIMKKPPCYNDKKKHLL